ncbi:MAG: HD-GYP domain-containing protein [Candidatus Krumholzibacteriia bacterium]
MGTSFTDLATVLARGISHCRMYFDDHPNVVAAARDFTTLLRQLLAEGEHTSFRLGVTGQKLIHDGRYLVGPSIVGSRLTRFAEQLCCGGFEFDPRLEPAELQAFFALAARTTTPCADLAEAARLLAEAGIDHVDLVPIYNENNLQRTDDDEAVPNLAELIPVFRSMFDTVEHAHQNAQLGRALDMSEARTAGEALVAAATGNIADIMSLVRYPDFDSYTVGHSVRVAMLSVLTGRRAGMPPDALTELAAAALLHDVGKGKIPQEILFKPGKLDQEERRVIETHPAIGAAMLLETRDAGTLAVATAWGHHRRHDGGGYPKMPHGGYVSELTQLVHVCDVFEALTAVRPYKRALTPRDAWEIILKDRAAYSPLAVTALRDAVGLFPPGSQVVLSGGHRAVVTAAGRLIDQPRVRLTHDAAGNEIPPERQLELDLADGDGQPMIEQLLVGT